MNQALVISAFGALSQETRLGIVRYLVERGDSGASAGQVGKAVGASSSRVSFHLTTLERAGLVTSERQSRHIIYRADFERLGRLVSFLLNDCCGRHPNILSCCNPAGDR